jgi:F0F1-type ATP synthase membrane subunit b/b'
MITDTFLIYTIILILYIAILFFFFWRRNKKQEDHLNNFLVEAKGKLKTHKEQAKVQASGKVNKAFQLIKRLQGVAEDLETQAQAEYEQILEQAQQQKKEIIADAKRQAKQVLEGAGGELEEYKQERKREIERNLVKLVMSVTEKVVGKSLYREDHVDLIKDAVDEVKKEKGHL